MSDLDPIPRRKPVTGALRKGVELVSAGLFTVMFAGFLLQIVSRYVFISPIRWTLELCLISYLWMTFWNCGLLLKLRDHIGFTLIYDAVRPGARRVLAILGMAALAGTFLWSLPGIIDWTMFMKIGTTDVFQLRLDLVFSVFVLFCVAVVIRALVLIWHLAGRNWRDWI